MTAAQRYNFLTLRIINSVNFSDLILFEDNHLLIVNKPAGMLVQGDETGDPSLVDFAKDYIKIRDAKPGNVFVGLVHRIDRPVSGVVMLAKTSKALDRMSRAFKDRLVEKIYMAVVKGKPPEEEGRVVSWIEKDTQRNVVKSFNREKPGALRSELGYSLRKVLDGHSLLEVRPVTGRPHQIRVQLSRIGCPIKGDLKYGYPAPNEDACINLHARKLVFAHPVSKERMEVKAPLPAKTYWKNV